ncbi:hypothetical protein ES703_89149 [subsurface metagenome]
MYKNPKELLVAATSFPAAIEEKLPEGAPKLSTMLRDTAEKMPDLPNFLVEIPDLPAPPAVPGSSGSGNPRVTGVEVTTTQERGRSVLEF